MQLAIVRDDVGIGTHNGDGFVDGTPRVVGAKNCSGVCVKLVYVTVCSTSNDCLSDWIKCRRRRKTCTGIVPRGSTVCFGKSIQSLSTCRYIDVCATRNCS